MALRLFYLLVSTSLIASAATTHLHKREEGLRCDARESCVSWYTTGSAGCASGYETTHYEVKGEPVGTYCETPCSEAQKNACAEDKCSFYSSQCNTYPGNHICADAMTWCNAPKAMPKASCTHTEMGFAVVYDDEKGECSVDKNPDDSEHYLHFKIRQASFTALNLYMSCAPVTLAGSDAVAANVSAVVKSAEKCSAEADNRVDVDPAEYEQRWLCYSDRSQFDNVEKVAKAACAVADYPGDVKPVFLSNRG